MMQLLHRLLERDDFRRFLTIGFVLSVMCFTLFLVQNATGVLIKERREFLDSDLKKEKDGAYRFRFGPDRKEVSEHLREEVFIYENGRALDLVSNHQLTLSGNSGTYSVVRTAVWIVPYSGKPENLRIVLPYELPIGTIATIGVFGALFLGLLAIGRKRGEAWASIPDGLRTKLKEYRSILLKRPGILMGGALIVMAFCYQNFILSEVSPYYPRFHDQNAYLNCAYIFSEYAKSHGLIAPFLAHFFQIPEGGLFGANANLNLSLFVGYLFYFFGSGRLIALSVHFASWAVLILVIYSCFKKLGRNPAYGWVAAGFFLFTDIAMVGAGGISDFRLDFVSTCWMGISTILWTLFLFQPKRETAWFASFAVGVLLFVRLISAASIGIPLAFLFLLAISSFWTGKRKRLRRAIIPLCLVGIWTASLVAINYEFIKFYYVENSLGPELEARGGKTIWDDGVFEALKYYPETMATLHFGITPLISIAVSVLSVLIGFLWCRRRTTAEWKFSTKPEAVIFLSLAIVFPLIILSLNPHRISHVAGVSTVPLGILFLLLIVAAREALNPRVVAFIGGLVLIAGTVSWSARLDNNGPFSGASGRRDGEVLNMVMAQMAFNQRHLSQDRRTVAILDFIEVDAGLWYFSKEKLGFHEGMTVTLPGTISSLSLPEMRSRVLAASAVIAPRDSSVLANRPYPISRSIEENFDELLKVVKEHLPRYSSFAYQGVVYDLFMETAHPDGGGVN